MSVGVATALRGFVSGSRVQPIDLVALWIVLTVVAYPFLRVPRDDTLITFDRVAISGIALLVLVRHGFPVPRTRVGTALLVALACMIAAFGLRAALAFGSQLSALQVWVDAILLPAVVLVVTSVVATTPDRCRRVTAALSVAGATLACVAIAERVLGFELASLSGGAPRLDEGGVVRVSGTYPSPEVFALTLVVCLAGTVYWLRAQTGGMRIVGIAAASIEVAALTLGFLRATWLAALIVVLAFVIDSRRRLVVVTGLAATAIAAIWGLAYVTMRTGALEKANLAVNPSFEHSVGGWVSGDAILIQSDDFAVDGQRSLKIVSTGRRPYAQTSYTPDDGIDRRPYSFSLSVKAEGLLIGRRIRMRLSDAGGAALPAFVTEEFVLTGDAQRVASTIVPERDDRTTLTLQLLLGEPLRAYAGDSLHVDAVLIHPGATAGVYAEWNSNITLWEAFALRTTNKRNVYARLATYVEGLTIFAAAPLIGVGINRYEAAAAERKDIVVGGVEPLPQPHNTFVAVLAEQGIAGFIPLAGMIVTTWLVLRAYRRKAVLPEDKLLVRAATGAGLAYLVVSLTLTMLPYGPPNAFLAVLLGAALGRLGALASSPRIDAESGREARSAEAKRRRLFTRPLSRA